MTEQHGADEDALRAEIDQTRTELGETVEALAAKTHVSARAKEAAGRAAEEVKDAGDAALNDVRTVAAKTGRFAPFAFIGAVVAAVAGWRIWRRRSR
jgi:hypothetical protein